MKKTVHLVIYEEDRKKLQAMKRKSKEHPLPRDIIHELIAKEQERILPNAQHSNLQADATGV